MEFDKHHSCVALRDFVEYANHCDKKADLTKTVRTVSSNNNSGSSRGSRSSRNRYSSRRGMRSSVGSDRNLQVLRRNDRPDKFRRRV